MNRNIFVSYARPDRERIEPLVKALASLGYGVLTDEDLRPGDAWADRINEGISAAQCVFAVATTDARSSRSMRQELAPALEAGKLIPVALDRTPPPTWLSETQAIDLADWDGRPEHPAFQSLVQAVSDFAGRSRTARAPTSIGTSAWPSLAGSTPDSDCPRTASVCRRSSSGRRPRGARKGLPTPGVTAIDRALPTSASAAPMKVNGIWSRPQRSGSIHTERPITASRISPAMSGSGA